MTPQDRAELVQVFARAVVLTAVFFLFFLTLTVFLISALTLRHVSQFAESAGTNISFLHKSFVQGWYQQPESTDNKKNILILGVDELETRHGTPVMTDTIMLLSTDLETGTINTLSLPRDLWIPQFERRINALYQLGIEQQHPNPTEVSTLGIETLTGIPIHHTLLISFTTLSEAVDILGGIEIMVENGFTDTEFPRNDVDVTTETDPTKLYKTVVFEPGKQLMTGERVLEYVRSRKSQGSEGSDDARSRRQQLVIQALVQKTLSRPVVTNPEKLGQLYRLYDRDVARELPLPEIIATGKILYPQRSSITFFAHSLTIYPDDPNGHLGHPPLAKYNGQWVYEIRRPDQFQDEIKYLLGL